MYVFFFIYKYVILVLLNKGQKPDGSAPATLEIRKIPVEFNTISKLNEHFSKFGTVTNVQVDFATFFFFDQIKQQFIFL
jgi:hypothetical protein